MPNLQTASDMQFKNIQVNGPISIEPVGRNVPLSSVWILILGLTGVGKSSFVQCLSPGKPLKIAKNQLESVTHTVMAYRLINVTHNGAPISLIDTPGLSDVKISEARIVKMIQSWMKENDLSGINRMLYFDRITDIRMAGSRSRGTEIFKALTGEIAAPATTLVTTMWDQIANEGMASRVNSQFEQLQEEQYWKDFLTSGAGIVKFMNTTESALEVLDNCLSRGARVWFDFEKMIQRDQHVRDTLLGRNLHRNIRSRIAMLQQKFRVLEDDLKQTTTKADDLLRSFLLSDKAETEVNLQEVHNDLTDFGEVDYSDDEEVPETSQDRSSDEDEPSKLHLIEVEMEESCEQITGDGGEGDEVTVFVDGGDKLTTAEGLQYDGGGHDEVKKGVDSQIGDEDASTTSSKKPVRRRLKVLRRAKQLLCLL